METVDFKSDESQLSRNIVDATWDDILYKSGGQLKA